MRTKLNLNVQIKIRTKYKHSEVDKEEIRERVRQAVREALRVLENDEFDDELSLWVYDVSFKGVMVQYRRQREIAEQFGVMTGNVEYKAGEDHTGKHRRGWFIMVAGKNYFLGPNFTEVKQSANWALKKYY